MDKRLEVGEDLLRAGMHPCIIKGMLRNGEVHSYMGWLSVTELSNAPALFPELFQNIINCRTVDYESPEAVILGVPDHYFKAETRRRSRASLTVIK